MFFGKKIMVGVTGGIAVYKAADLVRELKKAGAEVRVIMTEAATHFVNPLTFEVLSENPVLLSIFPEQGGLRTAHIDWARWPDVLLICPATANTIGKIANGYADNALTTVVMATTAPVVFCPAMNMEMYRNPIYQGNEQKLVRSGFSCVPPGVGELACGETGPGRLADKNEIVHALRRVLLGRNDLTGKRILVTAGRTEEPIDPVRFLTNRSSGKMGYALAEKALLRGAQVVLISGPTTLPCPREIELVRVKTADEMQSAVLNRIDASDILIMAAAVGDYRPVHFSEHKIKKHEKGFSLQLERTEDILTRVAASKGKRIHVGFSVETNDTVDNSAKKLKEKNLDMVIINNPLEEGAGFEVDTNRVTMMDRHGSIEEWPLMSKLELADKILDRILTCHV
jgi:phosphopantothenoylcysteine decarboxylase / phosphopantothenate---cysteine ligase